MNSVNKCEAEVERPSDRRDQETAETTEKTLSTVARDLASVPMVSGSQGLKEKPETTETTETTEKTLSTVVRDLALVPLVPWVSSVSASHLFTPFTPPPPPVIL